MARRRRRRLKTWIYFPLAVIVIAIATLLFILFAKGGWPLESAKVSPTPDPNTQSESPTPTPNTEPQRLFPYYIVDGQNNGRWGYKTQSGATPFDLSFDRVQPFSEGLAFVADTQDGSLRYRLIDQDSNVVSQGTTFDDARPFKEGFAAVKSGSKWGFIDNTGALRYEFNYDEVGDFSSGLARVSNGGKWGFIDVNAQTIPAIAPSYDVANDFAGSAAVVGNRSEDGTMNYFVIDTKGLQIMPLATFEGTVFSQGMMVVRKAANEYVFYNNMGVQQFAELGTFEDAKNFSEQYAAVKQGGAWGFIDNSGTFVVPCKYEDAQPFSDGQAAVMENEKWGYIDASGTPNLVGFVFDTAESFDEGYATASIGNDVYIVGKDGQKNLLYSAPEDAIISQQIGTIKLTSGNMNVRKTASTEAEIVTKVANGHKVTITDSEGEWYRVTVNGVEGYVKKEFIVLD